MKKQFLFLLPLSFILLITACQKEVSTELSGTLSSGSLQSNLAGECLPKTVQGIYEVGKVLKADSNYIDVQVQVVDVGTYRVYSDTINGMFFESKGNFASAGLNTVRLAGVGTPLAAGVHNFTLTYGSTACAVTVTTIAQGGGTDIAEFTFTGAPDACMNYVLAGDYVAGVPMTGANTVAIDVDVTALGTYTVTSVQSNGLTFSGAGAFTNLGQQTITLTATGTPAVAATTNIPIQAGGTSCNFSVTITTTAAVDYFPMTAGSNWSYQINGDANDSLLIRAKAGTVIFGLNSYTVFEATTNAAAGFGNFGAYRKIGSNYHTYLDLADNFAFDQDTVPVDYIFLKDDVAAATTWRTDSVSVSFGGIPVKLRIALTVEQKDVTVNVAGIDYANTIVVIEKYEGSVVPNTWVDLTDEAGYVKSYYARNIGLIKQDYYDPDGSFNPPVSLSLDMRRYQVF
ncbi:MAG: hypothetical protein ACXWWD_06060 [Chitinophagaceae bacterium]